MALFKNTPCNPMYLTDNTNHILKFNKVYNYAGNKPFIYTVFDGELQYNSDKKLLCLDSKKGFKAYYENISRVKQSVLEGVVESGTLIGMMTSIKKGIRVEEYFKFWLEYKGEIINALPYLDGKDENENEKEDEEVIVSKPIKIKGSIENHHVVERDGEIYVKLDDLAPLINTKIDDDGITCLSINRNKSNKSNKKVEL